MLKPLSLILVVWAAVGGAQSPQVEVIAPVDPAITIRQIGGGSFSERTLALLPYTRVLHNNTTHDVTGLAVMWEFAGAKPQTLLMDSYTSKQPIVPAKGMLVLTPNTLERADAINVDRNGRRIAGIPPAEADQNLSVSRAVITIDAVIFDNGVVLGPDHSGLVANMTASTELAAAEAKWAANKPTVYEFTIHRLCFCAPIPPWFEPIVFRVEAGSPSLISGERTIVFQTGTAKGMDNYNMIEKQFACIRAELAKHPYRTDIEYDAFLGYPTRVYIDPQQNVSDEEYGFKVDGFRIISRR